MNGFQEFRARHMAAGMRAMLPIETEAHEATVEILELNSWLDHDVACDGPSHPAERFGHVVTAPARFRVRGHTHKMCAPWVEATAHASFIDCLLCGGEQPVETLIVTEL